ncbi:MULTISPECIES: SRPBCC family protein [Microbacterium]|uniref:SRPBCC family protein n=1 Tax=Microbacterium barkeri TaxID=33917 RepID=UPI0024AF96F1|nr:SRPBCC family protein [Microbacterium barkeri]MDI6944931.1 SRPBCC family protein [Microbacterium barkeri]
MRTALTGEIDVDAPPGEVYARWRDVEGFPEFVELVESVRRVDDIRSFWTVRLGRTPQTFYADIVDDVPERRICWQSTDGALHCGRVDFEPLDGGTHVALETTWDAPDPFAAIGLPLDLDHDLAQRDLERFKHLVEERSRTAR